MMENLNTEELRPKKVIEKIIENKQEELFTPDFIEEQKAILKDIQEKEKKEQDLISKSYDKKVINITPVEGN